jgi:uncharacterized protein DUF4252
MNRLLAGTATAALIIAGLVFSTAVNAAGPELRIPDFQHLHSRARDSVDITLDGFLLRLAQKFAADDDEDAQILRDIKSVRVRNYEFDSDDAYSRADVDSVRKQLTGPGWSALATVHKREPREDVDVFLNTDNGKILGLAVIASEARSFTIVNIVGNIDFDKLARISGELGIPKVSQDE